MNIKPRALRTFAIGGSVLAAVSLTAVAVHAATTATARPAATARTATIASTAKAADSRFHPFTIVSPDFREDGFLPVSAEFGGPGSAGSGCSGKNQAPALHWFNVPAGTKSFAFTITDVDAPVADFFHHWIVYNIPRGVTALRGHGSNPFSEGTNDYPTVGYGGPCPPSDGQIHHYIFTVYALSVSHIPGLHLTYPKLISAISPDVVGATSTIGKFRLPLDN
ncbi:MAG TPA: YbhB/YbcL family Raf kinase inhibitor-like protein [Streptosporangiaceae bacterium]